MDEGGLKARAHDCFQKTIDRSRIRHRRDEGDMGVVDVGRFRCGFLSFDVGALLGRGAQIDDRSEPVILDRGNLIRSDSPSASNGGFDMRKVRDSFDGFFFDL